MSGRFENLIWDVKNGMIRRFLLPIVHSLLRPSVLEGSSLSVKPEHKPFPMPEWIFRKKYLGATVAR